MKRLNDIKTAILRTFMIGFPYLTDNYNNLCKFIPKKSAVV